MRITVSLFFILTSFIALGQEGVIVQKNNLNHTDNVVLSISGKTGFVNIKKADFKNATVSYLFKNESDKVLKVSSFKIKVLGYPTIVVNGDKIPKDVFDIIKKLKKGHELQIFDAVVEQSIKNQNFYFKCKQYPVVITVV